ncbi:GDP/GTP exchange factor for ARF [Puccinia graminis f. sp. tritici]|nr:GDP/GTP exchange factor for ARF [Puccinia graminis f. sp. tritici]
MINRLESSVQPSVDVPAPVLLARDKEGKRALLEGAAKFNQKPKEGLKFLEAKGIIYDDPTLPRPQSLAFFFKTCPRLDKKLLGEYISRPENLEVLKAFMTLFDFRGKLISDCLRELLETFRLPGESQQIARITEVFAAVYVAAGAHDVKTEDAAYVLSYSVIMLNTDQHNPQNRKKMTLEDYKRNLRGVNDGEDFSAEYLVSSF